MCESCEDTLEIPALDLAFLMEESPRESKSTQVTDSDLPIQLPAAPVDSLGIVTSA